MKRRTFVNKTPLAIFAALAMTRCKYEVKYGPNDFGVQLWTVRDAMSKNPIETLKAIKEIGYTDIENAGYNEGLFYGMEISEFKSVLKDLGLKMRSGHVPLGWNTPEAKRTMAANFEAVCEDHVKLGVDYIVCPWFSADNKLDNYKRLAELMNVCGEMAKQHGLTFAYHNHDFEFRSIDGEVPYDILLNETDKALVDFELDLYWIKKGGADWKYYFKNHAGRFSLWHVKDMDDTEEAFFTEVGNGIIDWEPIFLKKEESGMKHFYLEQDDCRNYPPLESIKIGFNYIDEMKLAKLTIG